VGDIPDADEVKVNYSFGDGEASITFLLQHEDLDTLNAASRVLQQHLASTTKPILFATISGARYPSCDSIVARCRKTGRHFG
jgi:hypothetical protein